MHPANAAATYLLAASRHEWALWIIERCWGAGVATHVGIHGRYPEDFDPRDTSLQIIEESVTKNVRRSATELGLTPVVTFRGPGRWELDLREAGGGLQLARAAEYGAAVREWWREADTCLAAIDERSVRAAQRLRAMHSSRPPPASVPVCRVPGLRRRTS